MLQYSWRFQFLVGHPPKHLFYTFHGPYGRLLRIVRLHYTSLLPDYHLLEVQLSYRKGWVLLRHLRDTLERGGLTPCKLLLFHIAREFFPYSNLQLLRLLRDKSTSKQPSRVEPTIMLNASCQAFYR